MNNYFKFALIIVQTTVCCFANGVIDLIGNIDLMRCRLYNLMPDTEVSIDENPVNRDASIAGCTQGINSVLETAKVSDTRATDAQRKIVMQAIMGGIVVHQGDDRFRLKAHGRKCTDKHYKHYEILRLTEELAFDFAINGAIQIADYDDLVTFSGLSIHTICDWMDEALENHSLGIVIVNAMSHGETPLRFVPSSVLQNPSESFLYSFQRVSCLVSIDMSFDSAYNFLKDILNLATSSGSEDSFAANVKRQNQKSTAKSTTRMFASSTPKPIPTPSPAMKPVVSRIPDVRASKMPVFLSAQRKPKMFLEDYDFEMPAAPSRPTASSKPFKGNWTESFRLKTGETIHHTPEYTQIGIIWNGPESTFSRRSNYNGFPLQNGGFTLKTNSTRDEFVAELKKSGIL